MSSALIDGRYRLERQLRSDEQVVVWAAMDERLNRRVALKLPQPQQAADPAWREAYQAAIGRAAGVSHPNLIPLLDSHFGTERPFVVEALVEGPTLGERLASGERFPAAAVEQLADRLSSALAAAHAAGLAHGGLNPDSVVFDTDGEPRVTDLAVPTSPTPSTRDAIYLAPERVLGSPPSARADVFSLAALLYLVIDGQPPFDGDTPAEVNLAKLSHRPRPLEAVAPDVSAGLRQAVESSLVANPDERPANATAFRDRLAAPPTPGGSAALDPTVAMQATQVMPQLVEPRRTMDEVRAAPEPYAEPAREPSSGLLPWLGALVAVALIAGLWFALRSPDAEVPLEFAEVPAVIGESEQAALQQLREAGLEPVIAQRANSDTVPGGQVIAQAPEAGEPAPDDKTVQLTISLGPKYVVVPDLRNWTEDEAKKQLPKKGLRARIEEAQDLSHPDGVVVAQAPSPGQKVDKGGVVTLYINRLPETAPAPAETPSDDPPPAEESAADQVIDAGIDAAKDKAGELATEMGDQLKEKAKEQADALKEKARESIREKREELKDKVKERLGGAEPRGDGAAN